MSAGPNRPRLGPGGELGLGELGGQDALRAGAGSWAAGVAWAVQGGGGSRLARREKEGELGCSVREGKRSWPTRRK